MNYDRASQDSLLGSVTIPLSFLKDQYPRENPYELLGYDKNEVGTIFLSLQWLHSQEKYLSDTLSQWDEHIKQQEEDLLDFQKDLSVLYAPFSQYVQLFRNDIVSHQQQQYYGNNNIAYKLEDQPGVQFETSPQYEKIDLRGVALQGVIEVDKSIFQLVQILIVLFFALTLLSHLYRPAFIDWMICLATILFYELHIFDHQRAKVLLICICVSCIFDFFWLFTFSSGWWSTTYDNQSSQDAVVEVIDSGYRRFAVCMSYLSFLLKFPLAFGVMRLWRALEDQLQGKTVVKEKLMNTLNFNRSPEYAATQVPFGNIQVPPQGNINKQYITDPHGVPQLYSFGNFQQSVVQQTPFNNLTPSQYRPLY